ncbi:hypothetical protein HRH25_03530 [Flavisolibacter sp. BT320]|nr:hypothetical protein [Flavisolibacter longurius]
MKKLTTRLLYVFSFSLLFTALYLNFVQKDKETSFHAEGNLSPAALTGSSAVATPENTVLK